MENHIDFSIVGSVFTGDKEVSGDDFLDSFIDFIESKGWEYCGVMKELPEEEQVDTKELIGFYEAYNYLEEHPIFNVEEKHPTINIDVQVSSFQERIDIEVKKVNPLNDTIDDNSELNTKTIVWLEAGPYLKSGEQAHDCDLDCGGNTFEEAIIELANLVKAKYGDDKDRAFEIVREQYGDEN